MRVCGSCKGGGGAQIACVSAPLHAYSPARLPARSLACLLVR